MSSTFLEIKQSVANRSGRVDGSTPSTVRDNAINNVIRDTIANAYPFSWLRKTTTVATDTSGNADLPSGFNPNHGLQPGYVRIAAAGAGNDQFLSEIPIGIFDRYDQDGQLVFFIDFNTSTGVYRINSSEISKTITITYFSIPTAMVGDSAVCEVPDSDCVMYLASARVWLGKERDETNHDRDNALGLQRLNNLILLDKRANPRPPMNGSLYTRNLGFN